jgi:hypothetical protein
MVPSARTFSSMGSNGGILFNCCEKQDKKVNRKMIPLI